MLNLIRKLVEIKINFFFRIQVYSQTGLQLLVEWVAPPFPEGLWASHPPGDLPTLLRQQANTEFEGGVPKDLLGTGPGSGGV